MSRILTTLARAQGTALLHAGTSLTYPELNRWSMALGQRLSVAPGTPVGLLARSEPEYFAGLLAIWHAGGMAVPLQPAHPRDELEYLREDAGFTTVLVSPSCSSFARELNWPVLWLDLSERDPTPTPLPPRPPHQSGALMIYTSGTTGRPKGVVTSYAALDAQVETLLQAWAWSADDRTLNVLPLHHVHGVVVLGCCALAAGARMELATKFTPELVWSRIANDELSVFMAVPTVYSKLLEHYRAQPTDIQRAWAQAAGRLRLTVSGSAAFPTSLFAAWQELSGTPLLERYGMTEIGMALSNPRRGPRYAGYVGHPLPGVQVRLSASGELEVRGPSVFREYWRKPDATAESFTPDGWFKTGDVAEYDPERGYRILGRSSQDIIKTGGYKVSALEIESRLLEHPGVREAAVLGLNDPVWGERVTAIIVPAERLSHEDLEAFLAPKLARYKIPTVWHMRDHLPRNAMGKVLKTQLKRELADA